MPLELAYGFADLESVLSQRITEIGVERVTGAVRQSVQMHTQLLNEIMSQVVFRTTLFKEVYDVPATGTLQPLDEHGNPKPVDFAGSYEIGYPLQGGGSAWGGNRVTRAMMTGEEANKFTLTVQSQDADWMRRHLLGAVFTNTSWTYKDKAHGDITVYPLANGDAIEYFRNGLLVPATDTHYLAQLDAIADAHNPFPTIKSELSEHPGNGNTYVAYVPSNLVTDISALTEFVQVDSPDIIPGSTSDRLSVRERIMGPGDEILGKTKSGVWIVEWKTLPDSYMFCQALDAGPFLAMREYPVASLQGLFTEEHSEDGNHYVNRVIRYCGFGVRNRTAALIMQIGAAAYAIPTGYQAPLAI